MTGRFQKGLCWFRRDLRLEDHKSLAAACSESDQVAIVFVFDTVILNHLEKNDRRLTLIIDSLLELQQSLSSYNAEIIFRHGDPVEEIPQLAQDLKIDCVFTNHDYAPYPQKRDAQVARKLKDLGVSFKTYKDQVIFEKDEILNQSGLPFKVFTPYKKAWLKKLTPEQLQTETPQLKKLLPLSQTKKFSFKSPYKTLGFDQQELILKAGPQAAHDRFQSFLERMSLYHDERNRPDFDRTSYLSVDLRFGTISIRELVRTTFERPDQGSQTWLSELIWREFYQMILYHFPHVKKQAFRKEYDKISWPGTKKHFELWCQGQTGYPIVDAAMRYFNKTGWMHNRLRMIVAMFLTKDLLCHWRWGERYFAKHLLDYDLASNNGGWQWSASTGTDAQPYFRIFNPTTQSQKFDPDGFFIQKNIPELSDLPTSVMHQPTQATPLELQNSKITLGKTYPYPIVTHADQRQRAIALFKNVAK